MYEIENINQRKIRSTKKLDTVETFSKSFKIALDFPEKLVYHKYSTKKAEEKNDVRH